MINRVVIVGRLTKDVELKKTNQGKSVSTFTLAVNRDKEKADFIQVDIWEKQAEFMSQYGKKGMLVGVDGSIRTEKWEYNGRTEYSTHVLAEKVRLLERKKEEEPKNDYALDDEELPY